MATVQRETALVVISDPQINFLLDRFLRSAGFNVVICPDSAVAKKELAVGSPALMILGEKLSDAQGLDFATGVLRQYPAVPIILFVSNDTPELLKSALRLGVSEYLCLPLKAEDILKSVQNSLTKARLRKEWVLLEARRATTGLSSRWRRKSSARASALA
jgi:two-component system NtrC family sensor kinase